MGMNSPIKVNYESWHNKYKFEATCIFCLKKQEPFYVTSEEWNYFHSDEMPLIQKAYPNLTSAQREIIRSGICNDCWEGMFEEDEK